MTTYKAILWAVEWRLWAFGITILYTLANGHEIWTALKFSLGLQLFLLIGQAIWIRIRS